MKKSLAILGAVDRFNYGDLLFPLIIEQALKDAQSHFQFEYYGLKRSNLSVYGAKPTRSVRDLIQHSDMPEGSVLMIAGGDVLGMNWMPIHLHHLNFVRARVYESYFKVFGKGFRQGMAMNARLAKRYGAGSFVLPWIPPKADEKDLHPVEFPRGNPIQQGKLLLHNPACSGTHSIAPGLPCRRQASFGRSLAVPPS